jgi:hypothetical protein
MSNPKNDRVLVGLSVAWLSLLLLTPNLPGNPWAFLLTIALIVVNSSLSLWMITRRRKVLIALNCAQIALFGMLNYQLWRAFGHEHFRFDREPRFYDWIEFTGAHVLRAADVLDALDQYGINVHPIAHQSPWAGLVLVCMHLMVDVFLVGVVLGWANRLRQDPPRETRLEHGRREARWLLITLALFVVFAICQRMQPLDWLLWPIDNLIRLVDVGDVMEVYGWRLHGVEPNYWTNGADLLFRLCAGIWMARLINYWRLTVFRTWGLSMDELIELLDDPDAQMRRGAIEGLGFSGCVAKAAVPQIVEALRDYDASVRPMAAWALGQIGVASHDVVASLVDAAWRQDRELRLAALDALARLGPDARLAAHDLVYLLKAGDRESQRAAAHALDRIAPGLRQSLPVDFYKQPKPPKNSAKRPSRRKAKRKRNWQSCVDASQARREREKAIDTLLRLLWDEGYFAVPRDTEMLLSILATRGEVVERRLLLLPLLRLMGEGKLTRTRSAEGGWVYGAVDPCVSSPVIV